MGLGVHRLGTLRNRRLTNRPDHTGELPTPLADQYFDYADKVGTEEAMLRLPGRLGLRGTAAASRSTDDDLELHQRKFCRLVLRQSGTEQVESDPPATCRGKF
jgi:hypothetical protein